MDDFAHLLLGYLLYRFLRLCGISIGRLELALILIGSILPDPLWALGIASYAAAHTLTYYFAACLPFAFFRKTRLAALCAAAAIALHIIADAFMHKRATVLFSPLSNFSIIGTFNYYDSFLAIASYWLILLCLLALSLYIEKRKTGKITLFAPG